MGEVDNFKFFSKSTLDKGKDYYLDGRVKILSQSDDKVTSIVKGSENYNVSLSFTNGVLIKTECNCPVYDKYCKHVAAVLYALNNKEIRYTYFDFNNRIKQLMMIERNVKGLDTSPSAKKFFLDKYTDLNASEIANALNSFLFTSVKLTKNKKYNEVIKDFVDLVEKVNLNPNTMMALVENIATKDSFDSSEYTEVVTKLLKCPTIKPWLERDIVQEYRLNQGDFKYYRIIERIALDNIQISEKSFTEFLQEFSKDKEILNILIPSFINYKYDNLLFLIFMRCPDLISASNKDQVFKYFIQTNDRKAIRIVGESVLKTGDFSTYVLFRKNLTDEEYSAIQLTLKRYAEKNKYMHALNIYEGLSFKKADIIKLNPTEVGLLYEKLDEEKRGVVLDYALNKISSLIEKYRFEEALDYIINIRNYSLEKFIALCNNSEIQEELHVNPLFEREYLMILNKENLLEDKGYYVYED